MLKSVQPRFSTSLSREFIVHPSLSISDPEVPGYLRVFDEATLNSGGRDALLKAVKVLAMTAYNFLAAGKLREKWKGAFRRKKKLLPNPVIRHSRKSGGPG